MPALAKRIENHVMLLYHIILYVNVLQVGQIGPQWYYDCDLVKHEAFICTLYNL